MSPHAALMSDYRLRVLSLAVVIGSTFFLGLAHGIGYPLTSVTFERWGAPAWMTGVAAGMPALAALVLLPFAPRIAARLGFVPAMAGGCALGLLGFALMPVWQSVEGWLVLRFLMGLGLLFPWLLGETWINTVTDDASRGRALALYVIALFGGYGAGPIVLGLLPVEGLAAFVLAGSALLLTSLPLLLARRLAPPMEAHPSGGLRAMLRIAPVGMMAALVAGVLEYAYISLLPTFALRQGVSAATALSLVSAFLWGGVALSFLFGWLADRMDRERLMLWLIAGFVGLAIPAGLATDSAWTALAATFALGGVACAFYTLGLAILGERFARADLASANAAFLVLYQLGTLGGPPVAGAAMDAWPPLGFVGVVVAFALVAGAAIAGLMRRTLPDAADRSRPMLAPVSGITSDA